MRRTVILLLSGLVCIGMPTDGAFARPLPMQRAPSIDVYAVEVAEASQRFGIAEDRIRAVMRAESGGNPRAVSAAGAMGLMQVMPATWASLTARYGLGADPFDARANILAGTAYLRTMLDRYGDENLALAGYNAGPGRVDDWRAGTRKLPAETIAYVTRLASGSGSSGLARQVERAILVQDWRTATLFTVRSSGPVATVDVPSRDRIAGANDASAALMSSPADAGRAATKVSKSTLFVPLAGRRP